MRTIDRTNQFKRDYKRELKGQHRATLEGDLVEVLKVLVRDAGNFINSGLFHLYFALTTPRMRV